jgi:hypothetical protein
MTLNSILTGFWDMLMENRIKLQSILNTANQFPQYNYWGKLESEISSEHLKKWQETNKQSTKYYINKIALI